MPASSAADGDDLDSGRDLGQRCRRASAREALVPWPDFERRTRARRPRLEPGARAACGRRSCSSAHPSPRPAHRCASAVQCAERGFSSRRPDAPFGLRSPKDARGLSRPANERLAAPRAAAKSMRLGVPRAERALRLARSERARLRHASPPARHHGASAGSRANRSPAGLAPLACALRAAPRRCSPRFFMGIVSSRCARRSR